MSTCYFCKHYRLTDFMLGVCSRPAPRGETRCIYRRSYNKACKQYEKSERRRPTLTPAQYEAMGPVDAAKMTWEEWLCECDKATQKSEEEKK